MWMSHVTHMNESRRICEQVMSYVWMSHGIQILEEGLKPILCIGESKEEYDQGLNTQVHSLCVLICVCEYMYVYMNVCICMWVCTRVSLSLCMVASTEEYDHGFATLVYILCIHICVCACTRVYVWICVFMCVCICVNMRVCVCV